MSIRSTVAPPCVDGAARKSMTAVWSSVIMVSPSPSSDGHSEARNSRNATVACGRSEQLECRTRPAARTTAHSCGLFRSRREDYADDDGLQPHR